MSQTHNVCFSRIFYSLTKKTNKKNQNINENEPPIDGISDGIFDIFDPQLAQAQVPTGLANSLHYVNYQNSYPYSTLLTPSLQDLQSYGNPVTSACSATNISANPNAYSTNNMNANANNAIGTSNVPCTTPWKDFFPCSNSRICMIIVILGLVLVGIFLFITYVRKDPPKESSKDPSKDLQKDPQQSKENRDQIKSNPLDPLDQSSSTSETLTPSSSSSSLRSSTLGNETSTRFSPYNNTYSEKLQEALLIQEQEIKKQQLQLQQQQQQQQIQNLNNLGNNLPKMDAMRQQRIMDNGISPSGPPIDYYQTGMESGIMNKS